MSPKIVAATARRVLLQLRHDPQTVALLLVVPCLLMILLRLVYDGERLVFDHVGTTLLPLFPFVTMFLVTSVTMLRERSTGTLERLLTMPLHKLDLLLGYGVAFSMTAVVQVSLACAVALGPLGLSLKGSTAIVVLLAVLVALLGMALGLLASAFAATEFQAVQFLPAFVVPQLLLCGLLVPRDQMQWVLRRISDFVPLSYAVDGINRVGASSEVSSDLVRDLVVIASIAVVALLLASATLRRRTV
jgi:ABC-2 type transport system permease protein